MIDVEDVSVTFGAGPVLDSVSASIPTGRFVGLVGPNGAGKTTLLRTISGVLPPDAGSVHIDGVDVTSSPARESSRLVSVVPQDTSLAFSFDVRHLVEMGRTPYRSRFSPPNKRDRQLVDDALERTNTDHLESRSVDELSGGERQRVVLARALAQDTPVILLDEPTASLDVNHQVEVMQLVETLVASGKTVVAAIHDLDLAARYCDELLVLAGGGILDRGPPNRVLHPETIETAFEASGAVSINPITWTPAVTTVTSTDHAESTPDRVHVVGTGERAASILTRLNGENLTCTLGPVTRGDAGAVTAEKLGLDTVSTDPFQRLGTETLRRVEAMAERADVTVVVPGGPLDSQDELWRSIRSLSTLVIETTGMDAPDESSTLDELRAQSIRANPESVLDALAAVDAAQSPSTDVLAEDDD